jgi:hypothetical protein
MASRREFLHAGLVASLLPVAIPANQPAAQDAAPQDPTSQEAAPRVSYYKVIFDERFPASVAFGEKWKAGGAPVHAIRGDITDLWFHDLDAQWKKQPVAIAGLTAHGPLFCLERLAWNHGMRVVSRVEQGSRDQDGEPLIAWVIDLKKAPKERA